MPASSTETPLRPEELQRLNDDGFVLLRGVLPGEVLDSIRAALAEVVERMAREWFADGLIADLYQDEPFELRWARIRQDLPASRPVTWRRVLVCRAMHELWQRPELTGRVRTLLGDELWAHDTWNGRPREPRAPVQTIGWHQDAHYLRGWRPDDGRVYTCWIPLVPVDALSGCLQLLPGSHLAGVLPRELDAYRLKNIPEDHVRGRPAETVDAMPGDVLLFTESTVHRSLDNVSGRVRWSVDIRFARDAPAMRAKAKGGFLCRSARPGAVGQYADWAAKYDARHGALAAQLRAIDVAADRAGALGRDLRTY